MIPVLIVETGAGLPDANSYCTVAEARAYHETVLHPEAWVTTLEDQTTALIQATRLLDLYVNWLGTRSTTTQSLSWPRTGVPVKDSGGLYGGQYFPPDSLPLWLTQATAEFARSLLAGLSSGSDLSAGLSSLAVSGLSLAFDKSTAGGVIPPTVLMMISGYGSAQQSGAIGMARLIRL